MLSDSAVCLSQSVWLDVSFNLIRGFGCFTPALVLFSCCHVGTPILYVEIYSASRSDLSRTWTSTDEMKFSCLVRDKFVRTPEGSCEIDIILLRSREILLRSLAIILRSLEIPIVFPRNTFAIRFAFSRNTNEIVILVRSIEIGISFPHNSILFPRNKLLFRYLKISISFPRKKYSLAIIFRGNEIIFRNNAILLPENAKVFRGNEKLFSRERNKGLLRGNAILLRGNAIRL